MISKREIFLSPGTNSSVDISQEDTDNIKHLLMDLPSDIGTTGFCPFLSINFVFAFQT